MTGPAQKWLIGVDMSSDSLHALRWAVGQAAGHEEARLRALFAIEPAYYGFAVDAGGQLPMPTTEMEDLAAVNLEARVHEVADPLGIDVDTSIAIGPPAAVILEESTDSDLLVVGSRGRGGFASLLLGSVSLQLANHADVPTVVITSDAPVGRVARVAVGVDGSANSKAALTWACDFAPTDAEIVAVGAWSPAFVDLPVAEDPTRDEAKKLFQEIVAEVAEASGRDVAEHFVSGSARQELTRSELGADLVVVGARGYGGLTGALMGSVATWVVHHAPCVAVVPSHDDD